MKTVRHLRSALIPAMVLACALGLTWYAWDHEVRVVQARARTQVDFALREISSRIEQHLSTYELILRSVASHLASQPERMGSAAALSMDIARFTEALKLDANYAGIELISFIARHKMQANEMSAAMMLARDSGQSTIASRRVQANGNGPSSVELLMYFPVYASAKAGNTLESKRNNLTGWVHAQVSMDALMSSLYGTRPAGVQFAVYDGVEMTEAQRLFPRDAPKAVPSHLSGQEYLAVGGQTWTVSVHAQPGIDSLGGGSSVAMIAVTGTAMSLLLALLAWSLANSRDRAVHMAKTMTRELRESEQRWAFALEGTGDGVWDWNLRTGLAVTSPRWHEIVACPQLLGNNTMAGWEARIHPDDLADFIDSRTAWLTAANNQGTWVIEHRICCPHVADKWILLRGMVAERDGNGHPLRVIGTITDITERHTKETSMRHLAQHDALTDLPNRMLFNDRLAQALATVKRNQGRLALIFLDLDNFKPVNDIYGHAAGDKLLQVVAQRLRQSVRAVDTVARIGGDEFVLLLPEMSHPSSAHKLADKICQAMRMPIDLAGQTVEVSCSMGLAIYPEDGTDEETLVRNADLAMYRAKQGGRNQVQRTRKSADASSLPGQ